MADEISDPFDIISVGSSPPGSPFELPIIHNKVSEMCLDTIRTDNRSQTSVGKRSYHSLSDSEDEHHERNDIPENIDSNLLGTMDEQVLEDAILLSPAKLSQTSENSRVTERKRLKEMNANEKAQAKAIKAQEKARKAKEKAERVGLLEKIRQIKPGQCMKYITVILDENIINSNIGKKAIELFQDVEFKFKIETQRDPNSVTWMRSEPGISGKEEKEKHILFIWSFEKLITSVKFCTLIDSFRELKNKYLGFRIYLAIYGLREYYKKLTRKSDESSVNNEGGAVRKRRMTIDVTREQIDMTLAELEVLLKVSTRILKNHHELSVLLQQITKAIAETPYRKEIEKLDMEKCWYARGDSRDCVRIDKDFNGLQRLWLQQLSEFNKSSLDIAKSIAEVYSSPLALYQTYQNLPTQKEKDLLLQDIQIKKGNNSKRRIGPELSRKISLLFAQENGDVYLSQE